VLGVSSSSSARNRASSWIFQCKHSNLSRNRITNLPEKILVLGPVSALFARVAKQSDMPPQATAVQIQFTGALACGLQPNRQMAPAAEPTNPTEPRRGFAATWQNCQGTDTVRHGSRSGRSEPRSRRRSVSTACKKKHLPMTGPRPHKCWRNTAAPAH